MANGQQVIPARLEGPRATYTSTTHAPPRRQSRPRRQRITYQQARGYGPTQVAEKGSAGVGLLEAEFFAIIFLLVVQLFVGTAGYGDKIMSFMKRGMLTAILFFFLALIAAAGPNAAKVSKGLGALVFFAILISTPGQDVINGLDNFFKAAWVGTGESAQDASTPGQSSSESGTAGASSGIIGKIESGAESAANSITQIEIPGIGPAFAVGKAYEAIKGLLSKL